MTQPVDLDKQRGDRKAMAENAILGVIASTSDLKSYATSIKDLAEAYSLLRSSK